MMRRTGDFIMLSSGLFISLLIAFVCFAGTRMFGNIDKGIGVVDSKVEAVGKQVASVDKKLMEHFIYSERVVTQAENRIRRLEEKVDAEHPQPPLGKIEEGVVRSSILAEKRNGG